MKTVVIKFLPGRVVKVLRYHRRVAEWLFSFLYCFGFKKDNFYPYFMKHKAARKTGVFIESSKDICHRWGEAFCAYNSDVNRKSVYLMWADGPIPGNYGDWLSPYIITRLCNVNAIHLNEVGRHKKKHIVALGSIISLANECSVVVGAGISSMADNINIKANIFSVRGPYTDKKISALGGRECDHYGDIGFLLNRVYKPSKAQEKKFIVVVRHIQHAELDLKLDNDFREVSINCAKPEDIESFIDELHSADFVATSAMHCFITCIAYSIPCVLFSIGDWKNKVPGDGIKYRDALAGVKLTEVSPIEIKDTNDFCRKIKSAKKYDDIVADDVLDGIEGCLKRAVKYCEY